jgi:hypothetical protein
LKGPGSSGVDADAHVGVVAVIREASIEEVRMSLFDDRSSPAWPLELIGR